MKNNAVALKKIFLSVVVKIIEASKSSQRAKTRGAIFEVITQIFFHFLNAKIFRT